jgi:hypothetical protein
LKHFFIFFSHRYQNNIMTAIVSQPQNMQPVWILVGDKKYLSFKQMLIMSSEVFRDLINNQKNPADPIAIPDENDTETFEHLLTWIRFLHQVNPVNAQDQPYGCNTLFKLVTESERVIPMAEKYRCRPVTVELRNRIVLHLRQMEQLLFQYKKAHASASQMANPFCIDWTAALLAVYGLIHLQPEVFKAVGSSVEEILVEYAPFLLDKSICGENDSGLAARLAGSTCARAAMLLLAKSLRDTYALKKHIAIMANSGLQLIASVASRNCYQGTGIFADRFEPAMNAFSGIKRACENSKRITNQDVYEDLLVNVIPYPGGSAAACASGKCKCHIDPPAAPNAPDGKRNITGITKKRGVMYRIRRLREVARVEKTIEGLTIDDNHVPIATVDTDSEMAGHSH